jgi:hypothetical protein
MYPHIRVRVPTPITHFVFHSFHSVHHLESDLIEMLWSIRYDAYIGIVSIYVTSDRVEEQTTSMSLQRSFLCPNTPLEDVTWSKPVVYLQKKIRAILPASTWRLQRLSFCVKSATIEAR